MRISVFVFVVAALAGCGAPPAGSVAAATAESEAGWRFAGGDAALVGRSSGIAFERPGPRPVTAKNTTARIKAHCGGCPSPASFEFDAASPAVPYELDAGIAESIVASVVFPAEGIWNFEPLGGQITVREPTSTKPPVVVVRPWSVALTPDCGPKQIEDVFTRFAQAFNGGSPGALAQALNPLVDFSMTGAPLSTFATRNRSDVGDYVRMRSLAGETIHPYLVYAASIGDNAVDLAVYFVRKAADLPSAGGGYRRAFAGARLNCADLLLLRFNADLMRD